MTKRPWGPSGVGPVLPSVKLSADQCKQILDVFDESPLADPDAFLKGVERAIHMYRQAKELARQSSPSEVRKNLELATDAALKLNDCMNDLDGNSRRLLDEVAPKVDQQKMLAEIIGALSRARAAAREYQAKGRLPEYQNQYLAAYLRALYEKHTGRKATTVKSGLFMELVEVVMPIATGKAAKALHTLAEKVVGNQMLTEMPSGAREFDPFVRKKKRPKNKAIS